MAQDCNLGPNQTFYCCFTRMTLHSDTQNRLIKSKSRNITILVHTIILHTPNPWIYQNCKSFTGKILSILSGTFHEEKDWGTTKLYLWKKLKQTRVSDNRNSDNKNAKMQHFNILFYQQSNKPKFKCYENQMNRTSLLELQAHTTH